MWLTGILICDIKRKRVWGYCIPPHRICQNFYYILKAFAFYGGNLMSTTMAKKENVQRKWYVLDAAGKPLGRTAVTAAKLLRGKHKPDFTPNVDCGDYVIIVNAEKAVLTGNKLNQKKYQKV